MTAHDDPRPPDELEDLERRIARAQGSAHKQSAEPIRSGLGRALKLGTELVAAVAVGAFLGWLLDRWFQTSPVLLLVFFALGVAAGFVNVFRAARQMNEGAQGPTETK